MKRFFGLLASGALASCATAPAVSTPAPGGPIVEVRQSLACPQPASRGLITVARNGKAERVIFDGLDFEPGKTKSSREQMVLTSKDAADLFDLIADSGWESMPEGPETPPCAHCCSGALFIKTAEGGKGLRYYSDRQPAKLGALIKGVDAILARGTWKRVVYEWEPQR